MGRGEQKDVVMGRGEGPSSIRPKFVFEKVDISILGKVFDLSFPSVHPKIVSAAVLLEPVDDKGKEEESVNDCVISEEEKQEEPECVYEDIYEYDSYDDDEEDDEPAMDDMTSLSFAHAEQW